MREVALNLLRIKLYEGLIYLWFKVLVLISSDKSEDAMTQENYDEQFGDKILSPKVGVYKIICPDLSIIILVQ